MELDSEGMDSPVKVIACNNETAEDYEVEKITGMRLVKNKLWFRVRWKGYGKDMATWEPRANLTHCEELLNDYVSKMEDKKYKQKKRRQMRNALIHTVKKKETRDDVMKTKIQAFQGNIRRKRFIKKFISKPNRYFTRVPQTKWQMNGDELEKVKLKMPEKSPLETQKLLPLETSEESPYEMPKELRLEKPEDSPLEKPEALPLESPKQKTPVKRGRGRPKKNSTKMPDLQPQTQLCPDSREPLEAVDDIIVLKDNSLPETKVETVVKRGRGRPRKTKILQDGETLQRNFCVPKRTKYIPMKRRKPKKSMVEEGVPKETSDHLWKGDIKLKKVVIRELRSLKALLEFQRQLSDEEKENLSDHSKEKPSSMEDRHVHASESHNRFYIRIKTGSFKDLSTKRRRKRKAAKEKRRKKREAAKEEQSRTDGVKNELLDNKQRRCDEVEEGEDNGCDLQDVAEISSSSGAEPADGDSVESQTDAPSLNEEYDEFGYDDFFDFSKDNDHVGDSSKPIDAELPPALEEKEMDGPKIPGDVNEADESNNHEDESNSKPEQLTGDDAVNNDDQQEEMEEDDTLADESSSLVIPFDEEEESSSLIIGDDGMEDDDDDDDEDDLREFGDENIEGQQPIPSAAIVITADSLGSKKKEVPQGITKDDEGYQKTEHFEESTEVVDSVQAIVAQKCRSEEDIERQQTEKQESDFNGTSSDFIRNENISKMVQSKSVNGDNLEDITTLSEDNSRKVGKQDSQIGSDEEFEMDEEGEEEEGINSASPIPMETYYAVEQSSTEKDWTKLNEEQTVRASQTPVVGNSTKEGDCAIEKMNSQAFSERKDTEEKVVAELEPQAAVLSMEEGVMKESMMASTEEINAVFTQNNMDNVEKNHASEVIDSKRHLDETDSVVIEEEQTDKECKVNTEADRETNDNLAELPDRIESEQADGQEIPSDTECTQGSMENKKAGGKDSESPVPVETAAVEESTIEKDEKRLNEEGLIKADQLAELERSCALAMTKLNTFSQNKNEGNSIGHDRNGRVAFTEMMQGECNIEEFRPTTDDSIDSQVTELSKCKELDGESEVDATKSQFSVAKETEQKEVILDDKMEDMKSSVLDRAAENLTQELTTPEETDKNDDQGAEAGQEEDEEIESAISGTQENRIEESKAHEEVMLAENHMPQQAIDISRPDITMIKEGDESEETDDTQGDRKEQVEEIGKSYCMERKEESSKEEMMMVSPTEIVREIVKSADQGEQEQRPTDTGDEEMESETASALEIIKKELALNDKVPSEKDCLLQSDTCSNELEQNSRDKTDVTKTGEVDDQGDQQQKPTKTGDEEIDKEKTNALAIMEKELTLDKEKDCLLQRDSYEINPNSPITTEDAQNVEVEVKGDQQQKTTKMNDEEIESETASALEIIKKQLALDEVVPSARECMMQRDSSEIKPKSSVVNDDTQNVEVDVQEEQQQKPTKMGDEEIESETASALEIIEKELVFDKEMAKDVLQRESDNMEPASVIDEEKLEAEDQKEEDKKGTKTDHKEMDTETQHVNEITDQESTMVKEVEGENKLPQEECNNMKREVTREAEKEDDCDVGIKSNAEHITNDDAKSPSGLPEVTSKMVEDETDSSKEFEVEKKEDDQMDYATVTPRKDEAALQEAGDKVERITKVQDEKICTSPHENVKDQNICNDEAPQVDLACNNWRATILEIPTAKDSFHVVGAEMNKNLDETKEKSIEHVVDFLRNICNKDGNTQDIRNCSKAELEKDLFVEKKIEEEVSENCHDNSYNMNDAFQAKKDEINKEEEKIICPEVELIDDNITDELKNKYNKNKQIMFFKNAESPKNRTTNNKGDVQEFLPKKKMEIGEKKNNGNSCKLQEPALLEKVRAESDDRKARERGREDKVKQLEEAELEEGELPEVEDDEEEENVDVIVENKDDREEGEIREETADSVEEISDEGEEMTPDPKDGLGSIVKDSAKVGAHLQKGESLRRRSQETFEIVDTSKSNSDHRTSRQESLRRHSKDAFESLESIKSNSDNRTTSWQDEGGSDENEEVTPVGIVSKSSVKDNSHSQKGESSRRRSQEALEILETSKSNSNHSTTRQYRRRSDQGEEVTPVGNISKNSVKDNSHSQKGESLRRRSQESLESVETSKSNTNHSTTRQYRRRSDQGEEVTPVGNISKNSFKDNSHSQKGESLRRRSQESLEGVETSKSNSNHRTTRQGSSRRRSQEAFEIVEKNKSNLDHRTTQQDGRRSDRGEEVTPVGIISKNSVENSSYSQKLETLRRRSQEAFEIVETSKSNSDHRTTQQDGRRSDRGEEVTPVGIITKNSVKNSSYSQKLETLRRRSQEAFEIVETSKSNSDHRTTQQDGEKRRTTRSSAINMKRNFNGPNPTKDHKRSKTLTQCDPIDIDDDNDDDLEIVEHDIHPKKTGKAVKNRKNLSESDVFVIEEDSAKFAQTESADQTSTFWSEHHSNELSPKFGGGIKKLLPSSGSRGCKVDKTGSKARKLEQSMKAHIQQTVGNAGESVGNGLPVIKNSACKAQGFKIKDAECEDRGQDLSKRLEGTGGGDADTSACKSGTKRKSDDDGDEGSKSRPKKKSLGASRKEVWQMVTKKEKKPAEPIWEGTTKINRQKIVIKISKKLLTDQPETKEPEVNAKRKEPERSSNRNGWKEAKKVEHRTGPAEQKEKREKKALTSRGGMAASTSTGAVGRWSALPKAEPDKTRNDASGTIGKPSSDKFLKDLKELKTHGIKQADLSWVRDLLETDHIECLSEACAALTKFMDSNDHKINLVVEMGFCPLLVKLLRSRSPAVISSALLAVSHIVSGNDYQTQAVLECSPLPLFCSFLSRNKYDVTLKKEACLALSNITAGTSQQIQHLVNDGLFPVLLSAMQHDEFQVMYEATWAVANATVNGSPEQIRYIVKQGFFQAFSEVLKHSDDTLVQIALDAMFNVLKLDTKPKKYGKLSPYCSQVKEYGGLQRIRSVRMTGSTVVKKKAYNMLNSFFPDF